MAGSFEVIEPLHPKGQVADRQPVGAARMLRIHLMQHWLNVSDPTAEEARYGPGRDVEAGAGRYLKTHG